MKTKPAYDALIQVVSQISADTVDENTIESLRNMLELPAFLPIRVEVNAKIIEVSKYIKSKKVEVKPGPVEPVFSPELPISLQDILIQIKNPDGDFEYENEEEKIKSIYQAFEKMRDIYDSSLEFDINLPTEEQEKEPRW